MDANYALGEIAIAEFVTSYCVEDEHTNDRVFTDSFKVGANTYTIVEHDYALDDMGFYLLLHGPDLEIKSTHSNVHHADPIVEFIRGTQEEFDVFCLMFAIQYPGVFREDDYRNNT